MIKVLQAIGRARTGLVPTERIAAGSAALKPASIRRASEFVHLFHAVNALNPKDQPFVLQFIASVHREGTSTVALGFVEAAASQGAKPILLVDCNPAGETAAPVRLSAPSLIDAFHETGAINAGIQPVPGFQRVALARLSAADDALLNIDCGDLRRLFDLAKQTFPIIVLDCPPATEATESLALARFSDGTVLVVRAEVTPRPLIAETKQAVERFGGQFIGVVFNQRRIYIPRWLDR